MHRISSLVGTPVRKAKSVQPVEIVALEGNLVLRARGSELLILPHHVQALKGLVPTKDFAKYFYEESLINRPARKLFEAWLRKDGTLWPRLYQFVHKQMEATSDVETTKEKEKPAAPKPSAPPATKVTPAVSKATPKEDKEVAAKADKEASKARAAEVKPKAKAVEPPAPAVKPVKTKVAEPEPPKAEKKDKPKAKAETKAPAKAPAKAKATAAKAGDKKTPVKRATDKDKDKTKKK